MIEDGKWQVDVRLHTGEKGEDRYKSSHQLVTKINMEEPKRQGA